MQTLTTVIEDAIRNLRNEVEVSSPTTDNEVNLTIRDVMREHPEFFWFSYQWHYSQEDAVVHFSYTIDEKRRADIWQQIGDVILNDFRIEKVRRLPVIERVMYVYKWVAMYCNYDIHSAHNQTIYSVFVLRNSVCTGISRAAQYLLKLLGIECRLVFGRMHNSDETSRHCWLIVRVDGRWYHLDPTFANRDIEYLLRQSGVEPVEGEDWLCYNYFCVDTETVLKSRSIEDDIPECNDIIDYSKYQDIEITLSRNGDKRGLGCLLSSTGTTADIYLAHSGDKHDRKHSVAKVFRNDVDHELLRKEAIVMRECAGPHLLRATDADYDNGILYVEQAIPLSELLSSYYFKMTLKELCRILIDITAGLQELQEHGILYRDIHLNNIYLSGKDIFGKQVYKLGDFGSCTFVDKDGKYAGLTEKGGIGSKWYMAPETWNGNIFDERSAVYGVGMIAYFLLNDLFPPLWKECGEYSYKFRCYGVPVKSVDVNYINDVEVRRLIDGILQKSLSYAPCDRYQTLSELQRELSCLAAKADKKDFDLQCSYQSNNFDDRKNDTPRFALTCMINPSIEVSNGEVVNFSKGPRIARFAATCAHSSVSCENFGRDLPNETWTPKVSDTSFLSHLFKKSKYVYGSVFAPAEVAPKQHMMVQVYLHLPEETEKVKELATEADGNAERRGYEPLEVKLKKGDAVEIELNINGDTLLYNCRKSVVWQGSFVKRAFDYLVPSDIDVSELSCSVNIFVNGAIAGEMIFLTSIVGYPRHLNTNVHARPTKRLFVSYSHKDIKSAERIAKIHEALGIDVFFDRHRLKAGYIYTEEISRFIQSADTFVLCWSENAAQSDYVQKERQEALALAYPQCQPREYASLRIHPYNIEPHAVPPADMIEHYHFEDL